MLSTIVISAAVRTTSAEYRAQIEPMRYVQQIVNNPSRIKLMGLVRATSLQHTRKISIQIPRISAVQSRPTYSGRASFRVSLALTAATNPNVRVSCEARIA